MAPIRWDEGGPDLLGRDIFTKQCFIFVCIRGHLWFKEEINMRLSDESAHSICSLVQQICGKSEVWLFGSRVDDRKRGGDIDLYIETGREIPMMDRLRLMSKLQRAIGLRKIDVVIRMPNSVVRPIFHTAKDTGVRL